MFICYPQLLILFYQKQKEDDLNEQQVSEFFSLKEIPSIQVIGYNLFNNEQFCDKEGHGKEEPEEQKENKTQSIIWPVIQNSVSNEEFRQVLADIYNNNGGRIPHLERLLCWFPDYLCDYHNLTQELFLAPGPIPIDQRYYIAILASSNFGCEYLHSRLSQQFLNVGGDIKWLEVGLDEVKIPKLQVLARYNSKLAYHPSEVCKSQQMIEELIESGWQKNELVIALFIIAFYHGLACACQAFGLKSELDLRNSHISLLSKTHTPIGSNFQSPKNRNSDEKLYNKLQSFEFANSEIEKILKRMKSQDLEQCEDDHQQQQKQQPESAINYKKTSSINSQKDDINSPSAKEQKQFEENETKILQLRLFEKFKKFILNPELREKDERIPQTLRYSEFNYSIHGYQITVQYAQEIAQASKNVFEQIKNMTNKKQDPFISIYKHSYIFEKSQVFTFNSHLLNFYCSSNLSTTPFRKAIKLYIQNIFGYTHFDADYKTEVKLYYLIILQLYKQTFIEKMNALLPIPLKSVLRLTVKRPFQIKASDISNINLKLQPSEIAHIILIAIRKTQLLIYIKIIFIILILKQIDARIEIELIYFLNPFQQF